ncbi:hypothetical protein [Rhizobium ruizarguesonis]|uniref:hypothetical protein n=1 Tax=Rhizobium ruizarguesonis TaxID=2081791 RepID=UPI0013E0B5F5|nr:hypothetical protein [Rhizobium ruizarguesonis]NEI79062.1 hypothetical protein [Rhizobium ruizarguesonis]
MLRERSSWPTMRLGLASEENAVGGIYSTVTEDRIEYRDDENGRTFVFERSCKCLSVELTEYTVTGYVEGFDADSELTITEPASLIASKDEPYILRGKARLQNSDVVRITNKVSNHDGGAYRGHELFETDFETAVVDIRPSDDGKRGYVTHYGHTPTYKDAIYVGLMIPTVQYERMLRDIRHYGKPKLVVAFWAAVFAEGGGGGYLVPARPRAKIDAALRFISYEMI